MNDKRYLFRGFHPDEQGDATIVVNGEKVKGEWVYGYYLYSNKTKEHYIVSNESNKFVVPEFEYFQSILKVVPETVGQWVTTDKNGKDVFYDDLVKDCYGRILKVIYKSFKPMLELISYNKSKEWTNNFKYADNLITEIYGVDE